MTGGLLSLTAGGDNMSNGFTLDRMGTTKFPLYLILMEVAAQIKQRNLVLGVAWMPRDENEEADALTNGHFQAFSAAFRIEIKWADLEFLVLPRLVSAALSMFEGLRLARKAGRARAKVPLPKRARL